ncbi:hypothetical protein SAMN05414139_10445 [Burkholderia sp. D7]|jgi:hypothetical protein|nr:hypothetical protein SAMN05414139_10445 [Burkholderia sp. D7]
MPLDARVMRHALDIEHPLALFGEVSLCNLYGYDALFQPPCVGERLLAVRKSYSNFRRH